MVAIRKSVEAYAQPGTDEAAGRAQSGQTSEAGNYGARKDRAMKRTHLDQLIAAGASVVWLASFVQTVFDEIRGVEDGRDE